MTTEISSERLVSYLWQEFCELPDRTSPEEYPDMALVNLPELTAIVETFFELRDRRAAGGEAKRWLVEETLPSGAIRWECVEHEHQAREKAAMGFGNATVQPLYLHPSHSGVAVKALDEIPTRGVLLTEQDVQRMLEQPGWDIRPELKRRISAALHPSPSTEGLGVSVKGLEWEHLGGDHWRAPAPLFGHIRVESYGSGFMVNWSAPGITDTLVDGKWDSATEAKAAAQADYERRILSALSTSAEEVEITDEMVERAAQHLCENMCRTYWHSLQEDSSEDKGYPAWKVSGRASAGKEDFRRMVRAAFSPSPKKEG